MNPLLYKSSDMARDSKGITFLYLPPILTNHIYLPSPVAEHHRPLAGILVASTYGGMARLSGPG